jgi:pyrroloquinoline quinone biosynthesis protein B
VLRILVLGAAAGGGFPQWNANDAVSRRARAGGLTPRTQSSIAVSADGEYWTLLNASPDLRQQINERQQLQPRPDAPLRSSPIAAIVLTNADVDHVAGLLNLRESQKLALYAHKRAHDVLARNNIFNVLNPAYVDRRDLPLDTPLALARSDGAPLDVTVTAFAVPGKIALWLEDQSAPGLGTAEGDTLGLEIRSAASPAVFYYVPACAAMTDELAARLCGAALVFFDGTLWRDDEMIAQGVGTKTGKRMGHMSVSGDDGAMAVLAGLGIARKVFIHINNTNPLLIDDSPERAEAEAKGWEIACDGMEMTL